MEIKGSHPPTVYFPPVVDEALMVEPTETEPKEELNCSLPFVVFRVGQEVFDEGDARFVVAFKTAT